MNGLDLLNMKMRNPEHFNTQSSLNFLPVCNSMWPSNCITRNSFHSQLLGRARRLRKVVHSNIYGQFEVESIQENMYIISFNLSMNLVA